MLEQVTPVILTLDEEPNIGRTLAKLDWARRIVVVDSYSQDRTEAIARRHPRVDFRQRAFDTHTAQWNYGLSLVETAWVLSLDADYVLSDELVAEIQGLRDDPSLNGYHLPFRYCVFGKPLRASILPPRVALFRKSRAVYVDDGHTQVVRVEGRLGRLRGFIRHDDRKPLSRWLRSQDRYAVLEAEKLLRTPERQLSRADRLRRGKVLAPAAVLFYCLFVKRGLLDGWHGWYYALQRFLAETLLVFRLLEARWRPETPESTDR